MSCPPRSLPLPPLPPSGDDASRKDHYWNSCHPHPLPLSSPLSRNWGRQQPAGQKVKRGPLEQRKRGRDKSGVWIRAGGAGKEEAIRLKSSTALMDSNANIVAVVASENGKSANNTSAAWRRRRETLSRRPFYRPDGGVTFGHRRQGRDKRE